MKKSFLALLVALVAAPSFASEQVRLVIYHFNDAHGWVLPRKASFYKRNPQRRLGGCSTLGAFLDVNEPKDLLLDAGDWWQGTPEGGMTGGEAAVACFNALGLDGTTVGNHEFDEGPEQLKKQISWAKYPVLTANIYDAATHKRVSWVKPYILKDIKGVKVGLFGLITSNMKNLAFPEHIKGLEFRNEAEEAADVVRELKAQGAEVIIAMTHVGFEAPNETYQGDRYLAERVPGIDLIVGGHSHKPLLRPTRHGAGRTLIVQAGHYMERVGKAVLVYDKGEKRVVSAKGRLFELWPDRYGENANVAHQLQRYVDEVGRKLDVVVTTTTGAMARIHKDESQIGDWMADCMREQARAEIGFQNAGGIRDNIAQGPLTLRGIYQVMPFDNVLATLKLTGAQVRDVVEHGVSGLQGRMQISGLTVVYDPDATAGSRVKEVRVGGAPLKDDQLYSVVTNDFLTAGGDGYKALGQGKEFQRTHTLVRDALTACARRGPIEPPPLGRYKAAGKN